MFDNRRVLPLHLLDVGPYLILNLKFKNAYTSLILDKWTEEPFIRKNTPKLFVNIFLNLLQVIDPY